MGIVIENPVNVIDLLPLAGKVVLYNKIVYGILTINIKTNQFMLLSDLRVPEEGFALNFNSGTFEEVTRFNSRSLGILDSFDDLLLWGENIQWSALSSDWEHIPRPAVQYSANKPWDSSTGELIKTPYNSGGGLSFL